MDAIRNSENPYGTLESFWKGQINSKIWLIENLKTFLNNSVSIDIHGGWNGVLASLIFQSDINVQHIKSIDIDPSCQEIANTINKIEEINGSFESITADMCVIGSDADVVINTSCEHITQDQYETWLSKLSNNSLIVLQSNNYKIDEHVRIARNLEEFKEQSHIEVLWNGEYKLPLYTRYMLIGRKLKH
jgi:hypothetical protein